MALFCQFVDRGRRKLLILSHLHIFLYNIVFLETLLFFTVWANILGEKFESTDKILTMDFAARWRLGSSPPSATLRRG